MKISWYSIIALGVACGLVILAYGYFWKWSPNKTEAGYWRHQIELLNTEIQKGPAALKRYHQAEDMREKAGVAWQRFVAENTPPPFLPNGINLAVNPWQLAIDARKFRDAAQRALDTQLVKGGVKVVNNGPEIPAPEPNSTTLLASYFNFGQFAYPIVIWELGTVRVSGTYKQITENVRAWSRMRGYLAVVDGLAISGTSPQLEGTYNLVLVGYLRGNNFFGGVNEGSAPAAATIGGGGGGAGAGAGGPGGGGAPSNVGRMGPGPGGVGPPGQASSSGGGGGNTPTAGAAD